MVLTELLLLDVLWPSIVWKVHGTRVGRGCAAVGACGAGTSGRGCCGVNSGGCIPGCHDTGAAVERRVPAVPAHGLGPCAAGDAASAGLCPSASYEFPLVSNAGNARRSGGRQ